MGELDRAASEAGKREGMADAEAGAPVGWIEQAIEVVRWLALRYQFIVADDVWARGLDHPDEARALGPVFKKAQAMGLVEPTEEFVKTHQAARHRAPVMAWRSRLFSGERAEFSEDNLYSRRQT